VIAGIAVPQPLLAVPAAACLGFAWLSWRIRVVATAEGLTVVNRWKTGRVSWPEVTAVRVEGDERAWRYPYSGPTALWRPKLWAGVVMVGGDRLECDAFVSTGPSEGWGFGGQVAAQKKVAVLERWRQSVAGG